eukprot:scaffold318805_cov39-Prasinocladus_malaysianus.AAC.2
MPGIAMHSQLIGEIELSFPATFWCYDVCVIPTRKLRFNAQHAQIRAQQYINRVTSNAAALSLHRLQRWLRCLQAANSASLIDTTMPSIYI